MMTSQLVRNNSAADLASSRVQGADDFNEAHWWAQCEALAKDALAASGSSHDVYQKKISFAIDVLLVDLAPEIRSLAVAIARTFDYATRDELARDRQEATDARDCCHGIDRDCCPAGCGDFDLGDDDDYGWYEFDDEDRSFE